MSEEKMYALKSYEGKYWELYYATTIKEQAEIVADEQGGHVVTFVEEPEKVVLTKKQAEIVEEAHDSNYPASYIAGSSDDEKLIMKAYVNGYTVADDKKYNVKVPHTEDVWYYKADKVYLQTICPAADKKLRGKFTEAEIEHYGLQDCEREEEEK